MNMRFNRELFSPQELKRMYSVSPEGAAHKEQNDKEIKAVLDGSSPKLLIVVGPCSADREDAVLDYILRLRPLQDKVADKIVIVPRIYTNKPRTTGAGYKGMLHQPDPIASPDLFKGLVSIRRLHLKALEQSGLVASGLDIPVGMKNPTGGDLSVMMNSIFAAQHGHSFVYRNWDVESSGNPYAHAILRGYVDSHGTSHPNYHYEDLRRLADLYAAGNFQNPGVIVDCNHSNSGKRYIEQGRIAKEVLHSARHSADIARLVKGLMIESYIEDGSQKAGENIYGCSITDPCLGWEKTERLILELADLL